MSFVSFVAGRTLRARKVSRFLSFMTLVATGSVALGTAALIITFSILEGFERELRLNITGVAAHVQVGTFRNTLVDDTPATSAALAAVPNVARVSQYLQREAILVTGDNIDGVLVKGLARTRDLSQLRARLVDGAFTLDTLNGKPALMMGRRLAARLGLQVGDRLVLVGVTDPERLLEAPKMQYTIAGMYETGMAEYFDDLYVFVGLGAAQRLFLAPGQINGYDVQCDTLEAAEHTALQIGRALGYPFDPQSIFSLYRNLFVWIDLQQELIPIVVGSLIVVSVFNIIATLLLLVIEKTSDIGILVALGASKRSVRNIFTAQGFFIGLAGSVIGSVIALALLLAQMQFRFFSLPQDVYYMTTVPVRLTLPIFLVPAFAAMLLSTLASLVPAWLASRLNPITSIRFR